MFGITGDWRIAALASGLGTTRYAKGMQVKIRVGKGRGRKRTKNRKAGEVDKVEVKY